MLPCSSPRGRSRNYYGTRNKLRVAVLGAGMSGLIFSSLLKKSSRMLRSFVMKRITMPVVHGWRTDTWMRLRHSKCCLPVSLAACALVEILLPVIRDLEVHQDGGAGE